MRLHKLDLNLLVALDVLLKEQSISNAAEQLNLTPSAVSNALSKLRHYFQDDILTQVGRQMIPTPLGESLRQPVRDVLNMIESHVMIQPDFDPMTTDRVFTIFCSDYTQSVLMPRMLSMVERMGSTARFKFWQQIKNPHKSMEGGEADFLIIPEEFIAKSQPYSVLYEEGYVVMACQDSQIAATPMTLETYKQASHVSIEPTNVTQDFLTQYLISTHDIKRRVAVSTFSFSSLPALVTGTEYLITVHARLAKEFIKHWPLKILDLPFESPRFNQCLQWHRYRDNDQGMLWVRDMLHKASVILGK